MHADPERLLPTLSHGPLEQLLKITSSLQTECFQSFKRDIFFHSLILLSIDHFIHLCNKYFELSPYAGDYMKPMNEKKCSLVSRSLQDREGVQQASVTIFPYIITNG